MRRRRAEEEKQGSREGGPKVGGRGRRWRGFAPLVAISIVVLLVGLARVGPVAVVHGSATGPASSVVDNLSVETTSSFAFVPGTLTVFPGALVHLVVTQESSFAHTFVLSSVANQTIPASDTPQELYAFFNAHPPLVNLSVPGVVGARAFANFTAPSEGSYEFVCEIPGHFQDGMHGELVSTTQTGGSSSSPVPVELLALVAAVVVVAAAAAGVLLMRRRRARAPPGGPGPNP